VLARIKDASFVANPVPKWDFSGRAIQAAKPFLFKGTEKGCCQVGLLDPVTVINGQARVTESVRRQEDGK
jgi:hypothetical protein